MVGVGVPAPAVGVLVAGLLGGMLVGVPTRAVAVGVSALGVADAVGERGSVGVTGVYVAVKRGLGVNVGVTAAQPKSGVRHTPGVVCGVGKLQSAETAHEKSEKSPPSQKRPVEAQLAPSQWVLRKQPKPRKFPATHTLCVPTHELPVPQFPSPSAVRQESPANAPP